MLKIAITGSKGLIGSRVLELLKNDFDFIELELPYFDITDKLKITRTIDGLEFDIFFHLAAYTNVDLAEVEKDKARLINIEGTKNILDAVIKKQKKFIFVSTDFIFDGKQSPYYEDSRPNPLSFYAKTKFEAEELVKDKAMIVRFSYPYRANHPSKPDFVKRIRQLLEEKKHVRLMTDSLMTPTFIDDIAFSMKYLFNHFTPSVFHIVGGDSLRPYDAGLQIAESFNLNADLITKTTYSEYSKNKAIRPQYSDIKSKKNNFYNMKTFSQGLTEIAKQREISNF